MHFRRRQNLLFLQSEKQNPTKSVVLWLKTLSLHCPGRNPGREESVFRFVLKSEIWKI